MMMDDPLQHVFQEMVRIADNHKFSKERIWYIDQDVFSEELADTKPCGYEVMPMKTRPYMYLLAELDHGDGEHVTSRCIILFRDGIWKVKKTMALEGEWHE